MSNMLTTHQCNRGLLGAFQRSGTPPRTSGQHQRRTVGASAQQQATDQVQKCALKRVTRSSPCYAPEMRFRRKIGLAIERCLLVAEPLTDRQLLQASTAPTCSCSSCPCPWRACWSSIGSPRTHSWKAPWYFLPFPLLICQESHSPHAVQQQYLCHLFSSYGHMLGAATRYSNQSQLRLSMSTCGQSPSA